ncbi:MAG: hypothetical protein U0002_11295 [Thermoanaerobaculia bacterium]
MNRSLHCLVVSLLVAGCSTYATSRYSASVDNVMALKSYQGHSVSVGEFTSAKPGLRELPCRAVGPITTPDGEPFSEFVRKALIDELRLAEVYAPNAPVTLAGHLAEIDFSSVSGDWNIQLTVKSTNGKSLSVSEKYSYRTSYFGETACNQTAQALMPAVQDLIGRLVRGPEFRTLIE